MQCSSALCVKQINSTGDLLALSCTREVEHPVCMCYKSALALKVLTKVEDGTLRLEQVDTPFGIMKTSSLQVFSLPSLCLSNSRYPFRQERV